jgi:hypothetical protein
VWRAFADRVGYNNSGIHSIARMLSHFYTFTGCYGCIGPFRLGEDSRHLKPRGGPRFRTQERWQRSSFSRTRESEGGNKKINGIGRHNSCESRTRSQVLHDRSDDVIGAIDVTLKRVLNATPRHIAHPWQVQKVCSLLFSSSDSYSETYIF